MVFRPALVNDPFGDPATFVDFLFERRAMLFDLGDIRALPTRKILRVTDIFVSHAHMDHFFGFDWLLRLCLGREKHIRLYGPSGFIAQVEHKLAAYTWNLIESFAEEFSLEVTEISSEHRARVALFRCRTAFHREGEKEIVVTDGLLLDESNLTVRFAILDHRTPCLAFALQEKQHVNIWGNRLEELNLVPGPWLQEFKRALLAGQPDDIPVRAVRLQGGRLAEDVFSLAELAGTIAHVSTGQKFAYVTDAVYHPANAERIVSLARGADALFIETPFGDELAGRAALKHHLTAGQAGMLARAAGVKFAATFHFSPIYHDREEVLREQFERAYRGE